LRNANVIDLVRIFWRSLFIQASWNYERMLSLGFCFSAAPLIKKIIKSESQRSDYLRRNLGFFNIHPYFAGYILGATLKLEKEAQEGGKVSVEEIEKVKAHLSRSVAAVGDTLFWRQLKPLSAMIGMMLVFYDEVLGLAAFLLAYNIPHLLVRGHGLWAGYREGFRLVQSMPLPRYKVMVTFLNKAGTVVSAILMVLLLRAMSTASGFAGAGAFISGLILMFVFLKWKLPSPIGLAIILALGLLAAMIL